MNLPIPIHLKDDLIIVLIFIIIILSFFFFTHYYKEPQKVIIREPYLQYVPIPSEKDSEVVKVENRDKVMNEVSETPPNKANNIINVSVDSNPFESKIVSQKTNDIFIVFNLDILKKEGENVECIRMARELNCKIGLITMLEEKPNEIPFERMGLVEPYFKKEYLKNIEKIGRIEDIGMEKINFIKQLSNTYKIPPENIFVFEEDIFTLQKGNEEGFVMIKTGEGVPGISRDVLKKASMLISQLLTVVG